MPWLIATCGRFGAELAALLEREFTGQVETSAQLYVLAVASN